MAFCAGQSVPERGMLRGRGLGALGRELYETVCLLTSSLSDLLSTYRYDKLSLIQKLNIISIQIQNHI